MKKIVLFNGPPGSGKDTLANGIHEIYESALVKFAAPIKENCRNIYGLTQNEWDAIDGDQQAKIEPHEAFFGQTCRQVQINFSELFLKPTHGEDIFGKLVVAKIMRMKSELILVSDSGFRREAEVLVDKFGAENVLLVRIYRQGTTFEGDSRGYINLDDLGVDRYELLNNGSIKEAVHQVEMVMKKKGII